LGTFEGGVASPEAPAEKMSRRRITLTHWSPLVSRTLDAAVISLRDHIDLSWSLAKGPSTSPERRESQNKADGSPIPLL